QPREGSRALGDLLPRRGRGSARAGPAACSVRAHRDQSAARRGLQVRAPMKIAIMAPLVTAIREPQLGGSQAFVSDLARGLAGRGHEVHVYAASGSDIPGVTVVDTGADPRALAGTLYRAAVPAGTGLAGTAVASASPGADTAAPAR